MIYSYSCRQGYEVTSVGMCAVEFTSFTVTAQTKCRHKPLFRHAPTWAVISFLKSRRKSNLAQVGTEYSYGKNYVSMKRGPEKNLKSRTLDPRLTPAWGRRHLYYQPPSLIYASSSSLGVPTNISKCYYFF